MNKPTPQQEAIYDAIATKSSHVICEAVAGAGKTTTALGAISSAIGCKVGFIAFNKHIADELKAKLAGRCYASTLHSLGFATIRKAIGTVKVDDDKMPHHLQELRPEWFWTTDRGRTLPNDLGRATMDVAKLCKMTLTNEHDDAAIREMIDHYGIDVMFSDIPDIREAAEELLAECAGDTSTVDFADMVWLPIRLKLAVEQFDVLIVDESQDLSRCQQQLAFLASQHGRMVPVGDSRQAIYGFTGADPGAFPRLQAELGETTRRALDCPLTVTFRCPSSHVELAAQIVPQIEAASWASEGEVRQIEEGDARDLCSPGDLVIARRNAPLVSMAFRLIRSGVPAIMLGRDIGKGLTKLMDKMKADKPLDLIRKLRAHSEKEVMRLDRRNAPQSQILAVTDRCDCLIELASEADSLSELRRGIESLFAETTEKPDRSGVVTLASIHKAKGSEADHVTILDTECLPLVRKKMKDWEAEQELNLAYVALTRAKKTLTFAGEVPSCIDADTVLA